MRPRRVHAPVTLLGVLLAAALSTAAATGCSKSTDTTAPAGTAAGSLAPVPAPEGLAAEVFIPAPEATWGKARELSGAGGLLPSSFGGLVTSALNLPVAVAGEFDGAVPALGAGAKKASGSPRFVLGLHVKEGGRFVDQLTKGEGARFAVTTDAATHIALLTPKDSPDGNAHGQALGVLGNYLLLANVTDDLRDLGPYVAQTLPSRPPPKEDVVIELPESGLAGPVLDVARARWGRAQKALAGSTASSLLPFGPGVEAFLKVLGDASHGRVAVELGADAAHVTLTLLPKADDGAAAKAIASMAIGDAKPLLDMPSACAGAALWRESAGDRAAGAAAQADMLAKLLGPDVAEQDKGAIAAALTAEGKARGDWVALGVTINGTGPTATIRAPVASADQMRKALKQLTDLRTTPGIAAHLKTAHIGVTDDKAVIENLAGDVERVTLGPASGAQENGMPGVTLYYLVNKDGLFAAAGRDPKEGLRTAVQPEGHLGDNAQIRAAIGAIGDRASFAAVVDVRRAFPTAANAQGGEGAEPVVVATGWATSPPSLWGKLDLSGAALRELIRMKGGL